MDWKDEEQVKTWIEQGIREEIQKSGFKKLSEECIKMWIDKAIRGERRRIKDERNEIKLQTLKYGFVIIMTSSIWLFICMTIKTHAAS